MSRNWLKSFFRWRGACEKRVCKKRVKHQLPEEDVDEQKWSEFCDGTTIHGLRQIFGTNRPNVLHRAIWVVIWVLMFSICIYLCIGTVKRYSEANLITGSTFKSTRDLEFPAITVCNNNMFRKSKVTNSPKFMKTLARFSSLSYKEEDIDKIARQNWKYCGHFDNYSSQIFEDDDDYWRKRGYVKGMRNIATDSNSSVSEIWLFGEDLTGLRTRRMLLNHIVDDGICFTFNAGKRYLADATINGRVDPKFGYGISVKNYSNLITKDVGYRNGLHLLLRAELDEYCGVHQKYRGVGFRVIIHHPEDPPWFWMQKSLMLTPTNDYNVVLSTTVLRRRTSNMGGCIDNLYSPLSPNAPRYFKNQCYQQCFVEQVVGKCKCFPQFYYRNQDRHGPVRIDGEPVNITDYCWKDKMICLNNAKKNYLDNNPYKACPRCREACEVTEFNYVSSSLLFPTEHSVTFLTKFRNAFQGVTEEKLRKDYLMVNFYFNRMEVNYETESQFFTIINVLTYFGGCLGLFLGASVLSFGEVIQQAVSSKCTGKKMKRLKNFHLSLKC